MVLGNLPPLALIGVQVLRQPYHCGRLSIIYDHRTEGFKPADEARMDNEEDSGDGELAQRREPRLGRRKGSSHTSQRTTGQQVVRFCSTLRVLSKTQADSF